MLHTMHHTTCKNGKTTFSKIHHEPHYAPPHSIINLTVARSRRPSNSEHPGSMREHFPASKSSTALSPVYHPLCHNNNNNNNNSNGIVNNGAVGGSPTGSHFQFKNNSLIILICSVMFQLGHFLLGSDECISCTFLSS